MQNVVDRGVGLGVGSSDYELVVFVSSKRLYDIHVTLFDRFLHRKGNSAALQ